MTHIVDTLIKHNILPDTVLRYGIKRLLKQRIVDEKKQDRLYKERLITEFKNGPIALSTKEANNQHYEVPTDFFKTVLGQYLKYSSGYWDNETKTLDQAEENMLALSCKRAQLKDGDRILELGCGWGSLTLYMAAQFPNASITAISNSSTQKEFIMSKAKSRNLHNIEVITSDINDVTLDKTYDRAISIEMFEHMRNYEKLLKLISNNLTEKGTLFVHIFGHKQFLYPFIAEGSKNWMARHFFTDGIMPSQDIFAYFKNQFIVDKEWVVNGEHYQKTCEAWLDKTTQSKAKLIPLFKDAYPNASGLDHWCNWRVFFMSCAELFGFNKGEEWQVYHYLLKKGSDPV